LKLFNKCCTFGQHLLFLYSMNENKIRVVVFCKEYFTDFFTKQRQKVRDKILWTLKIIETFPQVPIDYLQHMEGTNGLYEIRAKLGSDIF
jgi:hypothetical protein